MEFLDLANLISEAKGNGPLWIIGLFIIRMWFNGRKASDKQTKESIAGLHDKINRIEMALAESGIKDLRQNIEALKEDRTKHQMNIEALWRSVEKEKRTSDQ